MTDHPEKASGQMLSKWRFAESEEDGEAWLRNPTSLQGYVDYESCSEDGQSIQRRIMVVTRAWLESQVQGVRKGITGPLWAALPPMIVVPDAAGEELRSMVDAVVRQGGLDVYSTVLSGGSR